MVKYKTVIKKHKAFESENILTIAAPSNLKSFEYEAELQNIWKQKLRSRISKVLIA